MSLPSWNLEFSRKNLLFLKERCKDSPVFLATMLKRFKEGKLK